MPEYAKPGAWIELLKYPLTIFTLLIALIIARHTLGITLGAVAEIGPVKFQQESSAKLADLEGKIDGALEELKLMQSSNQATTLSSADQQKVFEASQTVSDKTAQLASLNTVAAKSIGVTRGYIWIGNYKDSWAPVTLVSPETGQPITVSPKAIQPGSEYKVRGNMVVRDGLPPNDSKYYQSRQTLGTLPRGTTIRIISTPVGIDREFAIQYWTEIELP